LDGEKPDIVRLGDNNLYSPDDDMYAQQFTIKSIISHPNYKSSSKYDDVALFLLSDDVELHDTVAPACLWREDDIRFRELEATGWGATHNASRSERLMKVTLSTFSNSECSDFYEPTRRMKEGIRPTQLCAGDSKSDTCQGDSGGPLEIKLSGAKFLTPFLVGITSAGQVCGSQLPAIYTRVSSYIDWIEQSLNYTIIADPIECALQYKSFVMDPEEYTRTIRTSNFININENFNHFNDDYNEKYAVSASNWFFVSQIQIVWRNDDNNRYYRNIYNDDADDSIDWECSGVLISENYVLTSAQCLGKRDR
jgi:Trypsin